MLKTDTQTPVTMADGTKVATFLSGGRSEYPEPGWEDRRESPILANEVSCSCPGTCGFRDNGQCLLCPHHFRQGDDPYCWRGLMQCPYGTIVTTKGYTRRSKSYAAFKASCEADVAYEALKGPIITHAFCPVGEHVLIRMKTIEIVRTCDTDGHLAFNMSDTRPSVPGTRIGRDGQLTVFPLMHNEPSWVGCNFRKGGNWYMEPGSTGETWLDRDLVDLDAIRGLCEFTHPDMPDAPRIFNPKSSRMDYRAVVYWMIDDLYHYWPEMYNQLKGRPPKGFKFIY